MAAVKQTKQNNSVQLPLIIMIAPFCVVEINMGSGKSDPKPTVFGLNVGFFCEEMMKAFGGPFGFDISALFRNIGCIESKLSERI